MSANAKFQIGAMPPTAQIAQTQSDLDYANALQAQNTQAMGQLHGGLGEAIPRMLAAALLHSQTRDDAAKLASQQWGQYQQMGDALMAGLQSPGAGAAAAPPQPGSPTTPGPQSAPQLQIAPDAPLNMPGVAPRPSTAGNPLFDPDVIRAIAGEDGNPAGQRAVASVMMNRHDQSGMSLGDVARAPHQFDGLNARRGLNPGDPLFDRTLANVSPILGGQMAPTTAADHFYAPGMMPTPPGWAQGHAGQDIGGNRFFQLGYHGQPSSPLTAGQGMAPSQAPLMPQTPPAVSATDPNAAPPPLTSPAGAPPAPPQAGGMGGAPAGAAPQSAGAQPPPVQSIPTGPGATPEELQMLQRLRSNPATFPQFMSMAQEIAARHAAPVKLPDGYYYGPDGRAVSALQFQDLPGAANEINQVGPDGRKYSSTRGAFGSIPAGMELGADGKLHTIQGGGYSAPHQIAGTNGVFQDAPGGKAERIGDAAPSNTFRIPGAPGLYVMKDGQPSKVADDEYGPAQLGELRNQVLKSDEYKQAGESYKAWQAMTANANSPNGMSAYAMRDTFARAINPGAVARQGTIKAIEEAQGLPESVKSFFLNLQGDGNMSPALRQQALDAVRPFVAANMGAARALNQANVSYAGRHGVNPEDVTAPLDADPERFVVQVPHGNGGAPGGGSGGAMGGSLPRVGSPAQARALPPGTHFLDPNGVERVR